MLIDFVRKNRNSFKIDGASKISFNKYGVDLSLENFTPIPIENI